MASPTPDHASRSACSGPSPTCCAPRSRICSTTGQPCQLRLAALGRGGGAYLLTARRHWPMLMAGLFCAQLILSFLWRGQAATALVFAITAALSSLLAAWTVQRLTPREGDVSFVAALLAGARRGRGQQRAAGRRLALAGARGARAAAAAQLGLVLPGRRAHHDAGAPGLGAFPAAPFRRAPRARPGAGRRRLRAADRRHLHDLRRRHDPQPALCRHLRADLSATGVRGAGRPGLGPAGRFAGRGHAGVHGALPERPGEGPFVAPTIPGRPCWPPRPTWRSPRC